MYKLSNVHCEMPVQSGKYIFLINANTVMRYNLKNDTTSVKKFDHTIEEPIPQDDVLFVIEHATNKTILNILDQNTLATVQTYEFPFETTYGFHGTFVPAKNPSFPA